MKLRLYSVAEEQIAAAARWYEERQAGLGSRFLDAVDEGVLQIAAAPERWPVLPSVAETGARYVRARGFPYVIVFRLEQDGVAIVSVSHTAQLK
jgi:hypothetical protein